MRSVLKSLVGVAGTTWCVALAGATPMEHNAFLRKPVFDRSALISQVRQDPVVRKRYEAHFGVSGAQVAQRFGTLRLKPLTESRRYIVYNVDRNYKVRRKSLLFRRGTLVFVDAKGRPVLKRTCGNPMVAVLPPRPEVAIVRPKPPVPETVVPPPITPAVVTPEPVVEIVTTPEPVPTPVEPVPAPIAPVVPTSPVLPALPTAVGTPLWPLLGIPLIPIIAGKGGGDNNNPVPEPATLAVLGVGAAALMRRRKKG